MRRVPVVTSRGKRPNTYDLSGLVKKLKELAPQFKKVAEAQKAVEKPGGLAAI